jgi:predicted DNA-binding transcriptional regulator AlpA
MESTIPTRKIERRLNARDIEVVTGKHRQTIWRWEKKGFFPRAEYINGQKSWPESVVLKWLGDNVQSAEDREASRPALLNTPPPTNIRGDAA